MGSKEYYNGLFIFVTDDELTSGSLLEIKLKGFDAPRKEEGGGYVAEFGIY